MSLSLVALILTGTNDLSHSCLRVHCSSQMHTLTSDRYFNLNFTFAFAFVIHNVINLENDRGRELNPNLFFSNFSGAFGISRQNPGISRQKSLIPWVSRDIPNFVAPTPSRGRPPTPPENIRTQKFRFGFFFFRQILVSVKFVSAILGPEMGAPILWTPGKMRSFCRKNHVRKIPLFWGGGGGLGGGGGGECRFYFYGRADFSDLWCLK